MENIHFHSIFNVPEEKLEEIHGANYANQLLKRIPPKEYVDEWTKLLATQQKERVSTERSVLIFRLSQQWLGLATSCFRTIIENRVIHKIPHRTGPVLLGIINITGQLRLCVCLHHLLDIEEKEQSTSNYRQMLVIEKDSEVWAFPVDEIAGIQRFDLNKLENVPVNVTKATSNFFKGIINWDKKSIGYLDEELLFYRLRRSIQ